LAAIKKTSGRRESNPQRQAWKACTLPLSYARNGCDCCVKVCRFQDEVQISSALLSLLRVFHAVARLRPTQMMPALVDNPNPVPIAMKPSCHRTFSAGVESFRKAPVQKSGIPTMKKMNAAARSIRTAEDLYESMFNTFDMGRAYGINSSHMTSLAAAANGSFAEPAVDLIRDGVELCLLLARRITK
jgi:hypothetical protein